MANELQTLVMAQQTQFGEVLTDNNIKFEKEAEFALQLLGTNSYLTSIAMSNQNSLKNAIVNVAAIGITLNPARKLAYLVPRDSKVCLDISYIGLMHIAQESGATKSNSTPPGGASIS